MTKAEEYVFVLWGKGFDEASATVFVTEFRRVGLLVKVVGLTQRRANGAYGLALVPDITLDQVLPLAGNTICLVVPYTSSGNSRLRNDPRLSKLFEQVNANQATFVIGRLDAVDLDLFPPTISKIVIDSANEHLITVARDLAHSFSRATTTGS